MAIDPTDLDFLLDLPDLDAVGEVVQVDLALLPPHRALVRFADQQYDLAASYQVEGHVFCARCQADRTRTRSFGRRAVASEAQPVEVDPLPFDEHRILIHYREPRVMSYVPTRYVPTAHGQGEVLPRPAPYRDRITVVARINLSQIFAELPDRYGAPRPFYASSLLTCRGCFDWAALQGLMVLAAGVPSPLEVARAWHYSQLHGFGNGGDLTDEDLFDYFALGITHGVHRRHGRRRALKLVAQLQALERALASEEFAPLREGLRVLPDGAFAHSVPLPEASEAFISRLLNTAQEVVASA